MVDFFKFFFLIYILHFVLLFGEKNYPKTLPNYSSKSMFYYFFIIKIIRQKTLIKNSKKFKHTHNIQLISKILKVFIIFYTTLNLKNNYITLDPLI